MKRETMLIEADELLAQLDNPKLRIFDTTIHFFSKDTELTAYEEYLQGHIPGAVFFDHQNFSDSTSPYMYMMLAEAALAEQIGKIGIANDSEVVVYSSGILPTASRAWWLLHYAGHNNVRVLNGGLKAWQEAGGAIQTGPETYEARRFQSQLRTDRLATKEEVQAAMNNGQVCTVNTLPQAVYDKSHIQDSSLLSCAELMEEMHTFLPDDVLAERLQKETGYERVITYCGGGFAATVNAMAHLMAGNNNVAVYDGSMDEWAGEGLPLGSNQSS